MVDMISVICPFHNDSKWIPKLIRSLVTQTYKNFELVVVDNDSNEEQFKFMVGEVSKLSKIKILKTGGDNGYDYACNVGARNSSGNWLYFISPDVWLEPRCLDALITKTNSFEVTCPVTHDYDDDVVQSCELTGFDIFGNSTCGIGEIFGISEFMFIHKELFFTLGEFDSAGYMYGEEEDWSWRVWIFGSKVKMCKEAIMHHRSYSKEYHATENTRFLTNRNNLLRICKNSHDILLLLIIPWLLLLFSETLIVCLLYGPKTAWKTGILPLVSIIKLYPHIKQKRKMIKQYRQRGDLWMFRFFKPWKFGRWYEIEKILKMGLPSIKKPVSCL